MEQTKNQGLIALEMGNSPKVVKEQCFEIVDERAAKEYWSIKPLPLLRMFYGTQTAKRDGDDGGGLGPW